MVYYEVSDAAGAPSGYVFPSTGLAKGVAGYNGAIVLAVYVETDGGLKGLRILESNETPVYVQRLAPWLNALPGRNLFEPAPFADVDAATGATVTAEAVLRILERSGPAFAVAALGRSPVQLTEPVSTRTFPDQGFLCLTGLTVAAVFLRYRPNAWLRRVVLLTASVWAGVALNLQYSTQQVFELLTGHVRLNAMTGPQFLLLGVPVVVLLFGNIYCGFLCPFGALQELLGDLRPRGIKTDPSKPSWRYGRAMKYGLLLGLVFAYSVTRDYAALGADPLVTVFSSLRSRTTMAMAAAVCVLAVPYRRFWCRNLCPAGAFLALLGGVRALRGILPAPRPSRCDLGVRDPFELDCIQCDRCRYGKK